MFRRKGAWSTITNTSDRDTAISLLRSAGHGNIVDRNVDLILSSKVKIDMQGNIVELMLGQQDQSGTRFRQQQQQQQRHRYWDLSASVGQLRNLNKLVLYRCRSLPLILNTNELPELKCLELHFCDGNTMLQRREAINPSDGSAGRCREGFSGVNEACLSNLKMIGIHGGIWDAQSISWMKCMTSTSHDERKRIQISSHLEIVRFSFLQNEFLHAFLYFLCPYRIYTSRSDISNNAYRPRRRPISKLKHLTWVHSGMTDEGLERLLRTVVLPHHPNLSSIDVSGNQIRSIRFLFELCRDGMYPSISTGDQTSDSNRKQQNRSGLVYHPLRTLNLEHNPVLRQRISNPREVEAFELLLQHCFPLLGSLTPRWESWDARIEYLLRINRGGRVLVEGNSLPLAVSKSLKPRSNDSDNGDGKDGITIKDIDFSEGLTKKKIHLGAWPLVLERAYKTSDMGFLPRLKDATAVYYLVRNGPVLSEIFVRDST